MGSGVFVRGQPRHCICTNASRGLSAIAEFLVELFWCRQSDKHTNITFLAKVIIMTATWVMLVRCNYTVFRTIFLCTWVKLLSRVEHWLSRCTRPPGNRRRNSVTHYYGRTLSDASMLYFADVFFIFFMPALVGQTPPVPFLISRPNAAKYRNSKKTGSPWKVALHLCQFRRTLAYKPQRSRLRFTISFKNCGF